VSISQKLFDGGKSLVLRSINAIGTEITRLEALEEYYAVLDGADTAYYGVLEAGAALQAAESALETAVYSLSVAETGLAGGMISYGDYLSAMAEKEARETARNQARRDLALTMTKLKSLTGLRDIPEPEAVDFDAYEGLIRSFGYISDDDLDTLYGALWKGVTAKNPSLVRSGLLSQRADKTVALAQRDYLPTLSASVSAGLSYSPLDGVTQSPGRISISGSIPLDYWVIGNNVAKKKILRNEATLNLRDAEVTTDLALQTALLDAAAQAGSVLSSRKAYEYAQKHFEYVLELYRLSRNSVSDLADAAALVSSNHNQLIRAQYGFLRSLSTIRSLGGIDSDDELAVLLPRSRE
jgi:outer membrane protein TolC